MESPDQNAPDPQGSPPVPSSTSFAERDPRLARLAETALRLRAGAVSVSALRAARERIAAESTYPWEAVVDLILTDPVDPSDLFNRGLQLQREDIEGPIDSVGSSSGGAGPAIQKPISALREAKPVAASPGRPRSGDASPGSADRPMVRKKKANPMKVALAILIVRGGFYLFAVLLLLVLLVLLRKEFPALDIYEAPGRLGAWFKDLTGG